MNFFEHQEAAKKKTVLLVTLMIAAIAALILITTLVISSIGFFLSAPQNLADTQAPQNSLIAHYLQFAKTSAFWYLALGIIAVVIVGSVFKWRQLASGGRYVAESLGGRLLNQNTKDTDEMRALNVVEEMAIASGNPVPPVYIMEDDSINAFAAGLSRHDAVVGVTRGCVNLLTRDELQGVIAHEFSHIHNGDMRLNLKLIAFIHGIVVIGLIGSLLTRSGAISRRSSNGGLALVGIGIALVVIGYGGTFFANIIKAMVSRQREFLADASAVQFTRNPEGIGGALKKIGGFSGGAILKSGGAPEFSHMYFGQGIPLRLNALMATHPPLEDRIRRIEPSWSGEFTKPKYQSSYIDPEQKIKHQKVATAESLVGSLASASITTTLGATNYASSDTNDDQLIDSVGEISTQSLELTREQISLLPTEIQRAARNSYSARALVYCLLLNRDRDARMRQIEIINDAAHPATFEEMRRLYQWVAGLERAHYLILVDLCIPALKQLSVSQSEIFKANMKSLVTGGDQKNFYEWCLHRIVVHSVERFKTVENKKLEDCLPSIQTVFSATAAMTEKTLRNAAFDAAWDEISLPKLELVTLSSLGELESALDELAALKPMEKPKLLKALMVIIKHDKKATPAEAEIFRAIADILDCPIPPFYASKYLK